MRIVNFRFGALSLIVAAIGLFAAAGWQTPSRAQTRPPLPPELAQLARQLATVPVITEDGDVPPPLEAADDGAPVMVLRTAQDELRALQAEADRKTARKLDAAIEEVDDAWHSFAAGSPDLDHLNRTTQSLHKAAVQLKNAQRRAGPDIAGRVQIVRAELAGLSERLATDMLRSAGAAGVDPSHLVAVQQQLELGLRAQSSGDYEVAIKHFGRALKLAADTVTFDVALFEQNIKDALAGQTTGHAFSIAYLGQLYQGGESSGEARTSADPPATAQSPSQEMHVASVSKTLTAIVILRLLEENGLTPDALVAPYLPGDWVLGDGVDELTFRDFMTHRSGFGQINAGNSYEALRSAIATDVGATSWSYKNANFGLMRVLAAGLQGIDPVDYGQFDPAGLTTAAFLLYAEFLYDSIGVEAGCAPNDATPTVQYNLPDGGVAGYVEPDRRLTCGGYGWFISSNELAAVMTNLRNTGNLLSDDSRKAMQEGFLGFMDPAKYGWIGGTYGVYYMHGGDWFHGAGELHSCVVAFPIKVEVSLVINSERGAAMPYQCSLLRSAFDNAWVAG